MTKARDIADFKFENIVDTGTEGTKIALGTTAQRGSTQGQLRFNSTTGLAEYYTGTAFKSIDSPPTVSSVGATNITETQINANYDLSISGSGFNSGATVKFVGNDGTEYASPTVTVNSETSITARVPTSVTNANEPFDVMVTNVSGLSNTLADAFNINASPTWSTASGNIGTMFDDVSSTLSAVSASDPEGQTITYSETGGTVLSTNNLTLNSSTGVISGDPTDVSGDTTLTFDLRASDGSATTDRTFNIIVRDGSALLNGVDFFGDSSGKSLYRFESDGTDTGGVGNMSFGHPSSGTNEVFLTGRFGNGVKLYYGGEYGYIGGRNYTNFTVNHWFNPEDLGSYNQDFKGLFGHQSYGQTVITYSRSAYRFGIQQSGYTSGNKEGNADKYSAENSGCPTISNGNWYMLTRTRDGTDQRLYVNGVLGVTITEGISNSHLNSGGSLYLGTASSQLGVNTYGTKGTHDNLRIFNKKLTQSEVTELYNFESAR